LKTNTTLSFQDTKSGTNARGGWTLTIFKGGDNREYTTFDGTLASKIQGLDGQLLEVEYEEGVNKKGYPTISLKGVSAAQSGAAPAPVVAATNGKSPAEFRTPLQIQRVEGYKIAFDTYSVLGLDPVQSLNEVFQLGEQITTALMEGVEVKEGVEV
jgi:hypothetical protein